MSVKKTKPVTAKVKVSAEFKLLLATSAVTKTAVTEPSEQEDGDPIAVALVHGHGRPTPPTIVTFKDRDTADIAHDSIVAFNAVSTDVAIHVVKLYV